MRFYLFIWPFLQACKIWNPFRVSDRRTGAVVKDIFVKRRQGKVSAAERKRRHENGESENKCFTCKTIRSLDFSGE